MHRTLLQTVSHADRVQGRMHRCFPQSAASIGWIRSPRIRTISKTWPKALDISSLEFYPLLRSSVYPSVAVHVSHNGCRRSKTKPSTANKLYICQETDHLSLSTTIFCRCQQTVQLPPVPKPIQLKQINGFDEVKKCFKGNYEPTMYFVLCFVCCVSQYCVVPTIKCKNFFNKIIIFS